MKKYRLKQWYPSLPKEWKNQSGLVSFNADKNGYEMGGVEGVIWIIGSHEFKDEDHWELIEDEKPLFITDDDIEVFTKEALIYIVNKNFYKKETELCNIYDKSNREDFKYFFHESNADEYIWKNMRMFSYEEIAKRASQTELYYLETLAKERIEG